MTREVEQGQGKKSRTQGARLREYIRKLTAKCEEWEVSYEKQSKRIERHDEQHRETRRKASEIARWYQKLASDVEKRKTVCQKNELALVQGLVGWNLKVGV
jgi:chromosome segregation ATPase